MFSKYKVIYGGFMINTIGMLCNNYLFGNFSRFDKYFPYYDYSEFYSKGFNSWDLELEYLSLVNTFNDLRLNNDAMSSNSISYDEFLSY